jgi:hypothetical protein
MFLPVLRTRLRDVYISQWRTGMSSSPSLELYMQVKTDFGRADYLNRVINSKFRRALAQIRLSSQALRIESGKHRSIPRGGRICTLCNKVDLEDEYHFIIICPVYTDLRCKYIKKYFVNKPSMYKFTQLLQSEKLCDLKNLALYIIESFKLRNSLITAITLITNYLNFFFHSALVICLGDVRNTLSISLVNPVFVLPGVVVSMIGAV